MRRLRPAALILLPLFCLALCLSAWAGDTVADDPDAKKVSGKIPKKKFDLSGIDTKKPPEDPEKVRAEEEKAKEKAKEIVRYKATALAPEGAQIVLHFPDVSRMARSARKSPLGRLMAEEMLGRIWRKRVLKAIREIPAAGKGTPSGSGLVDILNRLSEVCKGEVLVSFYGSASGAKSAQLLVVAEMEGDERMAFRDSIEGLKKWSGLGGAEASSKVARSGAFEFDKLIYDKKEVACYGFVGNQLVVAVGDGLYQKVLEAAISKGDHSLARDSEWLAACGKLGKNADLYLKADFEKAMLLSVGSDAKAEQRKAIKASAKGIRYFAASLNFSTDAVRERFVLELEKGSELLQMMPRSAPNTGLAKLIPLDSAYYDIQLVEAGAALKSYRRSMRGMPPDQRKMVTDAVNKVFAKSNLKLEKDILPAFAGHFARAVVLTGMGATMDFDLLLVLQPTNREKVKEVLEGLERLTGKKFRSDSYMGAQLKYWVKSTKDGEGVKTSTDALAMPWKKKLAEMNQGPLGPIKAYAIANQYIILGTSARVVKLAVRQTDPARQSSCIEDKPDFREGRQSVGAAPNEISSGYLDLRRVAELCYSVSGVAGLGTELPPADKVLAELSGVFWSVRREKAGISVEVRSPVGMLPLSGAGVIGGWVAAMNAAAARERAAHSGKLKAIWRGMETFATDFGRYPLKPSELFKVYVENSGNFLTPDQEAADVKVRIKKASDLNTKSGYRYVTGLRPNSVAEMVMMYSVKTDARGKHWCLFSSGKVEALGAEKLKQLLGMEK
jgi:Protein of unknown function (DUF3352)